MGGRVLTSSKLTKVILLHTSWTSKCERSGPLEHGRKCAVVGYSTRRGTRHAGAGHATPARGATHRFSRRPTAATAHTAGAYLS